ncbi:replicative DNA helicase [Tsukamurella spumae]|uniref:replicative DNA helicase n=1 Tax=Tsukamurella spumae TaxID=44753 RepID=UPI0031D4AFAA
MNDGRKDRAAEDPTPADGEFGRQPPQDLAAEQSVLGGMMLSKDAIADVVEKIRTADFYRPAHQAIFDAVLELYGKGEPADAVTVAAELERAGELRRIGGAPYLHTLISTVPTAANAGYYAEIVGEKAILRRLVEAGTRIVQFGYSGADGQDVAEVVDRAQAEVYEVTERRTAEDYVPLDELLQPTMDELDSIASRGGISLGVPTGFADLDRLTNGLHPGQMIIVAARPGVGKALALDTPLPTPTGWTTMGSVRTGDDLLAADGTPTQVIAATEVLWHRPCYDIEFSDGTIITADAEHQWPTQSSVPQPAALTRRSTTGTTHIMTTRELADARHTSTGDQPFRVAVLATPVLQLPHAVPPDSGLAARFITDVRPVPSVAVRCVQVDNPDHLYLAGESMIPTHNSTLAMDFLRSCAIHNHKAAAMFSLEMSKTEIVMRLLSAEAKVKLSDMRGGTMADDDWTRLARRMGEISEAPLFIDDSPNLTMMEIRAKARRLKQRHDLKLVVVDYMQLMTSGKKVESRQQEVSEFSRQLKLLAKELELPVVAISQLNRGPEQRTDKRPQVSDLRESGCLPATARIRRADNGGEVTLGELLATGEQPLVWSLDHRMRLVARPMIKVFPSGRKEVFRLRTQSGRSVEATGNHPLLTVDGWIPLAEITIGDSIGIPHYLPTTNTPSACPSAPGGPGTPTVPGARSHSRPKGANSTGPQHGKDQSCDPDGDTSRRMHTVLDQAHALVPESLRDGAASRRRDTGSERAPVAVIAELLDAKDIDLVSTNDVYWDPVTSIESCGVHDVFDGTVPGTHNFIAEGVFVHNSLEQDADMVILLHRPDAFERDDPRAGEADIIVGKHRNGPTATVTVAHQLHLSRFVDMARG